MVCREIEMGKVSMVHVYRAQSLLEYWPWLTWNSTTTMFNNNSKLSLSNTFIISLDGHFFNFFSSDKNKKDMKSNYIVHVWLFNLWVCYILSTCSFKWTKISTKNPGISLVHVGSCIVEFFFHWSCTLDHFPTADPDKEFTRTVFSVFLRFWVISCKYLPTLSQSMRLLNFKWLQVAD